MRFFLNLHQAGREILTAEDQDVRNKPIYEAKNELGFAMP